MTIITPIYGDLDDDKLELIPQLTEQILGKKPIVLDINSQGGLQSVLVSFLDIVETAKRSNIIVKTIVHGEACSAASILAAAGTPGYRFISPLGFHMIHQGSVGAIGDTDVALQRDAKHAELIFKRVKNLYKQYANIPKLDKKLRHDNCWADSEKAIRWGLADKLLW